MIIDVKSREDKILVEHVVDAGQEHVFQCWEELSEESRKNLLDQLRTVDFRLLQTLKKLIETSRESEPLGKIEPPEIIPIPEDPEAERSAQHARLTGEQALRDGKVAVVLVAGGQGTRLGFDFPKGAFPIGPVSGKTLFEWHSEKILAGGRQYGVTIPWFIMTSGTNDAETRKLFTANDYYGQDPGDVFFFKQRMMPALDETGKLLLDAKDHFFESPNGHGGSLLALMESGAISRMKERSVEIISYFQIDNVLINIIDPVFIGYHAEAGAEMSSKMVRKIDPMEKVGLFCRTGGGLKVIEYSELKPEDMKRRRPDGSLMYDAGSIAIHAINVDFVESEVEEGFKLPYHVAHKKIPYIDSEGKLQKPSDPNGYKFETFVFDALMDTERSVVMEISREEEYSTLKNRTGDCSPETARRDMCKRFGRWLEEAGVAVARNDRGDVDGLIEISPLFATDRERFIKKCPPDLKFERKLYLGP